MRYPWLAMAYRDVAYLTGLFLHLSPQGAYGRPAHISHLGLLMSAECEACTAAPFMGQHHLQWPSKVSTEVGHSPWGLCSAQP